jgi:hypothetical protein
LSAQRNGNGNGNGDCMPEDAALTECFEAEKLNQLLGE